MIELQKSHEKKYVVFSTLFSGQWRKRRYLTGTGYKQNLMNDSGSAILFVLMMLVVLTIIGITSISTTNVEIKIAHNDKLHKQALYAADGGTEIAKEAIEQNVACPMDFSPNPQIIGDIRLNKDSFGKHIGYKDKDENLYDPNTYDYITQIPIQQAILFPSSAGQTDPRTEIDAYGNVGEEYGMGTQSASAYDNPAGGGGVGAAITYDIYVMHNGNSNSQYCIMINYKHIIGQEDACNY